MANKLVINLATRSSERVTLSAQEEQAIIDSQSTHSTDKEQRKQARKALKNDFLAGMTKKQTDGLQAILDDGNID
jgi:hypothetical protein